MIFLPVIVLLVVHSTLATLEDAYPDISDAYLEEVPDPDDIEVHRRNNHFLRFGRNNGKYDNGDSNYDEYDEYARPTRRTEKNDHFIRFGRGNKQAFLRFGREPQRVARDKSMYLRFGRSVNDDGKSSKRSKREAFPAEKRSASFLRFGRNSNFVRFGRDPENADFHPQPDMFKLNQLSEPALIRLLTLLAAHRQAEKQCASAA